VNKHPIHPAVVHFPIACWSLAVLADIASLHYGLAAAQWAGALLLIGCGMALLAAAAGVWDLRRVAEGPVMQDAMRHAGLMLTAFALFSLRLLVGIANMQFIAPSVLAYALDALGFACLMLGGWIGGRLVYTHGVGQVQNLPRLR
jgi:uncharacterized membrane protein